MPNPKAVEIDPENRLWHHYPMRRLEAEAIRDSLLAVSGRLDRTLMGPPIEPYRTAEDATKRLFKGPLDGNGRRSIYLEMTLMEPPRFLALFNQPIPKQTVGRRDVSNVPDQALAMLNDPFVVAMAELLEPSSDHGRGLHRGDSCADGCWKKHSRGQLVRRRLRALSSLCGGVPNYAALSRETHKATCYHVRAPGRMRRMRFSISKSLCMSRKRAADYARSDQACPGCDGACALASRFSASL